MNRLIPHPTTPTGAVSRIEVDAVRRSPGLLELTYRLAGAVADLAIPAIGPNVRMDELWRRTCFEGFVRAEGGEGYVELNFAPSTAWAAYVFDGYRAGMRNADIAAPTIDVSLADDRLQLRAVVELPELADAPWRLAISAVVDEASGAKSYWALAHPADRPDFHHDVGFVLAL